MVRMRRLELPRREAPDPKSGVYTNFTTSASIKLTIVKVVHPSGFEPETARLEGGCSIQLSYECIYKSIVNKINYMSQLLKSSIDGTPERTRTPNPQIRSLMLYPIEPLALLL